MAHRAERQRSWRTRISLAVHHMPLVPACALVMFGIGLSQWTGIANVYAWSIPALIMFVAAVVFLSMGRVRASMLAAWMALIWIGATVEILQRGPDSDALVALAGRDFRPLIFQAEIARPAVWRPNSFFREGQDESQRWRTSWQVQVLRVRDNGQWTEATGSSSLSVAGRIDRLLPGDRITVYGSVAAISAPTNPGQSDLRALFRSEHQFVFLQADTDAQITMDGRSWRRPVARLTALAVRSIDRAIHRHVPLGQAPLAAALVFGQRQQVDWDAQQQLLSTGTLHMLAISGMHIELVAGALWILCWLMGLKQRQSLIVVATTVALYAFIAGANPPVLRAVFVVLAVCVARWRGRRTGLANLLAFSGIAVLALRTSWISNVGVQLSFLAVATIALFARGVSERDQRAQALAAVLEENWSLHQRLVRNLGRWTWQMAALSFWVWLMTAPLIWINFHVVSLVAIPLNILLWPFLVIGLLSGLLLAVAWWFPPVAWIMGIACGISLWSIGCIVWLGDCLPMGHVWMPAPSMAWMIAFYALAVIGVLLMHARPKFRAWLGALLVAWLMLGMTPWILGPRGHGPSWLRNWPSGQQPGVLSPTNGSSRPGDAPPAANAEQMRVTFIDVGHGTSVLMELPSGEIWLYDAGHLGSGQRSHQEIAGVLWHVPTARIDRLFVSHADADHYNAIPGLLARFSIGEIVAPPQFWEHMSPELAQLRELVNARRTPAVRIVKGEQITSGAVTAQVLHPASDWLGTSDNSNSLTLRLCYAGRSVLLPGDLEKAGIDELVSQPSMPADLLMAPHHGSMTHDPRPLIQWCRPQWIVISGGSRAASAQVQQRYTPSGTQSATTHLHGAIQCRIHSDGAISLWHWDQTRWSPR